jgi:hypothetical protein
MDMYVAEGNIKYIQKFDRNISEKKQVEETSVDGMAILTFITWTGFVSLRIVSNEGPL